MKKAFALLKGEEILVNTENKLIPEEEWSQAISATEIVEKGKQELQELKEEGRREIDAARKKAEEEGYQAGLIKFNSHILGLETEAKRLRVETNRAMLPLVIEAAKKVVAKELQMNPDRIVDIVMKALTPVTQNKRIKIFVNKEDLPLLEQEKSAIKESLEQVQSFSIQEGDVESGGCIIETETGIINATLENQWRALSAALEKFRKNTA